MNTKDAVASWKVYVFGDWSTVISVRKYRDALIDQKPFITDPDDPEIEYRRYTIPCATGLDVFKAMTEFKAAGLEVEVAVLVSCGSDKTSRLVECYASTGEGYGGSKGVADIRYNETAIASHLHGKIGDAIKLLEEARA